MPAPGTLLCLGYGYVARHLARRLGPLGWRILGTSRDPATVEVGEGVLLYPMDEDRALPDAALEGVTHVLVSVPPSRSSGRDFVFDGVGGRLRDLAGLSWLGYLSTVGVYGDTEGAWIDETAVPDPADDRTAARVAAEQTWLSLPLPAPGPAHVFRLSGIYGPGRNALRQLREGRARRVHAPGQVSNRIHVEDIATTLLASMATPSPGAVYNLADDLPWPAHAVVAYAAGLLGFEPPKPIGLDDPSLGDLARSFLARSRRVSNRRIKAELGVKLAYPTFRDGLDALLAAGE